jgi:Domain of unknown function (DUF4337)
MELDDLGKSGGPGRQRDRWIGVYIGLLAVVLAICSMGGNNADKDATLKNIEASNTWAFFQAKNMRRHVLRLQVEELEILSASQPDLPAEAKKLIEERIAKHRAYEKRLTSEPEKGEGLDELFTKGKALEVERDHAMRQDPYFDYGEAFLQIAIVLASIAIISGSTSLLIISGLLGVSGALFALNGFTLLVSLPFLR